MKAVRRVCRDGKDARADAARGRVIDQESHRPGSGVVREFTMPSGDQRACGLDLLQVANGVAQILRGLVLSSHRILA